MFRALLKKFKGDPGKKSSKDPVCGMRVGDEITANYNDQIYAFCSGHCKEQFEKNPGAYITK